MKNTLTKLVLGTLIATTAFSAVLVPTAATVLASDWEYVEIETDEPEYEHNDRDDDLEWVDLDDVYEAKQDDEYVWVEIEDETPVGRSTTKVSAKLDKTHYGETRYANVSDFLALRSQATSDSKELARLAPNTKMVIIGTTGNWIKVYVPSLDLDGYVFNKYATSYKR